MHRLIGWLLLTGAAMAWDQNEDLLAASRQGDLAAVQALIEKGADIEAKTPYGQTPLYLATMSGHTKVVEFLLAKGAKADIQDTFYKAGLIAFAVMRKHYDTARLIIEKGGLDVNQNFQGIARSADPGLISAALATGKVQPDTLSKALELATDQKQQQLVDLLLKAGAKPPAASVEVDVKILESYAGTYKTDQMPVEIKASVRDGKLVLQMSGQPEITPKAKSATLFTFAAVGAEFEFDGPTSFTLRQGPANLKFRKVGAQ